MDSSKKCSKCGQSLGTRSLGHNRYYWAYLTLLEEETGNDKLLLHEVFKRRFLPPRFVIVMGKEYKLPASTTSLSPLEMNRYISKIEIETGIVAPSYD